jgi:hypothetical protein
MLNQEQFPRKLKRLVNMRKLLTIVAFLPVLSCTENQEQTTSDTGLNYFPVETGRVWTYDVDSLWYDNNTGSTTIDTFHYQYREQIVSDFTDAEGKLSQLAERYYRSSDTATWLRVNSAVYTRDGFTGQKVEENVRIVKLVFPPKKNREWNGNLYNGRQTEDFVVESFDEAAEIGGRVWPKTLRVKQQEYLNAIEEIRRFEIYARDAGMIYMQWDSINTQNKPTGTGTVSRGFRLKYTLRAN